MVQRIQLITFDAADTMLGYSVTKPLIREKRLQLSRDQASQHPLAENLFTKEGIIMVIMEPCYVEVHTSKNESALHIQNEVEEIVREFCT